MKRDELVSYCLGKPGAEESYPWGEGELVAKVGGKGFAFIGLEGGTVSVKCGRDAAEAAEWRDRYPDAVTTNHTWAATAGTPSTGRAGSPTTTSVS
jgi:predicted DNA-binding protein (MmcQ/YjbR family)